MGDLDLLVLAGEGGEVNEIVERRFLGRRGYVVDFDSAFEIEKVEHFGGFLDGEVLAHHIDVE